MKPLHLLATLACAGLFGAPAAAQVLVGPEPPAVDWNQNLGAQVPRDAVFRDQDGAKLRFGELFDQRPVILALVYYECPMLCTLVLDGLVESLRQVAFQPGRDFDVVALSIDPGETPALARANLEGYRERYGRGGDEGWRFLVGDEEAIRSVADAVGFEYSYVPETDEYAHAAGLTVLDADGVVSRYFFGVTFSPRDLRLGLVDAGEGKVGSPIDKILLRCFLYDPASGKYGFAIMGALRLAGLVTLGVLGVFVLRHLFRERRDRRARAAH